MGKHKVKDPFLLSSIQFIKYFRATSQTRKLNLKKIHQKCLQEENLASPICSQAFIWAPAFAFLTSI